GGGVLQERYGPALDTRWTFQGDGQLTTAPIVVNGYVYAGSRTGRLYAIDGTTGKSVWSTDVGAPIKAPDEQNLSQPLTGLGAGNGLVVVPATHLLTAYGQPVNGGAGTPPPPRLPVSPATVRHS
ncbi:MAG TPA: PQQ-binding-like beta-propeller repeat protein, partial [Streptomyces sp.]